MSAARDARAVGSWGRAAAGTAVPYLPVGHLPPGFPVPCVSGSHGRTLSQPSVGGMWVPPTSTAFRPELSKTPGGP